MFEIQKLLDLEYSIESLWEYIVGMNFLAELVYRNHRLINHRIHGL